MSQIVVLTDIGDNIMSEFDCEYECENDALEICYRIWAATPTRIRARPAQSTTTSSSKLGAFLATPKLVADQIVLSPRSFRSPLGNTYRMRNMAPPSDADARRALLPILGSLAAVGVALAVSARDAPRQIALETPGPSDVLLASFPKSGNDWARFLVGRLLAARARRRRRPRLPQRRGRRPLPLEARLRRVSRTRPSLVHKVAGELLM